MSCCVDVHFWRQSVVLMAVGFYAMSTGFVLSFPSVLNPVLLSPTSTIKVTNDQASWITSFYGIGGVFGFLTVPGIMQKYGRKVAQTAMNISLIIGFIMLIIAKDVGTLYAARCIQGIALSGVILAPIILAEYTHPKRRGYFITLKNAALATGCLLCHTLVLICTWQEIAGISIALNVVSILLTFLWPESPAYYAMVGRYDECDKSFIYLNGDTPKARKMLKDLVLAQTERREKEETDRNIQKFLVIIKKFVRKDFLKPFFNVTLLTIIIDSGGRYYNLAYIVQIITEITGNNSVAIYCSIGLDFLTVVACCTSSYIIRKLPRRSLLFSFGYTSVALMLSISVIVFLKSYTSTNFNVPWLTPTIILLNSFIFTLGVIPVYSTVSGELFPLEHRGSGSMASGIIFTLLYAITMKCTPIMMDKTGIAGTYGIYGLCVAICLVILQFILTETKDKTLQEIEDEIKGIERNKTAGLQDRETFTIIQKC
ncbi:facilitated trehalose transporter Tret1-like [Epargyreus clarus]|uniref:facilitated trehalose transporter Tret1-like n=1 Tax=Epargyreus clarus TaxID=520877 RepID=UPI003C2F26B8